MKNEKISCFSFFTKKFSSDYYNVINEQILTETDFWDIIDMFYDGRKLYNDHDCYGQNNSTMSFQSCTLNVLHSLHNYVQNGGAKENILFRGAPKNTPVFLWASPPLH